MHILLKLNLLQIKGKINTLQKLYDLTHIGYFKCQNLVVKQISNETITARSEKVDDLKRLREMFSV